MLIIAQFLLENPGVITLALGGALLGAQVRSTERIVETALMVDGVVVPTGPFHDPERVPAEKHDSPMVAGFVTDTGRFVGREEAAEIAEVAGPMTHKHLEGWA